jgi:hypothetical protein
MTEASSSTNKDNNPWIRNQKSIQVPLNPEGGGLSTSEGKALKSNDITIANVRGKINALKGAEDLQPTLKLLSRVLNSKMEDNNNKEKQDGGDGGDGGPGSSGNNGEPPNDSGFEGSTLRDAPDNRKPGANSGSGNSDNPGDESGFGNSIEPGDGSSGLFVPPKPPNGKPTPRSPAVNEESEDAGLFTPEQADKAAGRRSNGVVTHWRKQGYINHVMVGYGPPSARKWKHTTSSKSGRNFDQKETPKFGP